MNEWVELYRRRSAYQKQKQNVLTLGEKLKINTARSRSMGGGLSPGGGICRSNDGVTVAQRFVENDERLRAEMKEARELLDLMKAEINEDFGAFGERQRVFAELFVFGGRRISEIVLILRVSERTVRRRLNECEKILQKY